MKCPQSPSMRIRPVVGLHWFRAASSPPLPTPPILVEGAGGCSFVDAGGWLLVGAGGRLVVGAGGWLVVGGGA